MPGRLRFCRRPEWMILTSKLKTENMKTHTSPLLLAASLLAFPYIGKAQSFADFSSTNHGDLSGVATWSGYSDIHWEVQFTPNSDGLFPSDHSIITPRPNPNYTPELPPFSDILTGGSTLVMFAGTIDGTNNGVGYDLTFTYDTGTFADDVVFYLGDVDFGDFTISASLGGTPVDVSNWYFGLVQSSNDFTSNTPGTPSNWDGVDTLIGHGFSHYWVHQFKPTSDFDTLAFSYRNGDAGDGIVFSIGNLTAVPEPSSAFLASLTGAVTLLRRRRTT